MRALILERNNRVRRQLARYFMCAGYKVMAVEDPALLLANLDGVGLVAADAFDADLLVQVLSNRPAMRAILWTAEPMQRSLRYALDLPQISNICGRRNFESTPRPWEMLMVARRLLPTRIQPPSFSDFLHWGYLGFQEVVVDTTHRDALVAKVEEFVTRLGASNRVGLLLGELAHELLMNAMFDAPVDETGNPKYANDRKADLSLTEDERPTFRIASDGQRLAMQVIDPFGRLERSHVFGALHRGLSQGELDASYGGAGLGLVMCHNATVAMLFDVVANQKTEVTGIFDLSLSLRDFRAQAKSLHYFAE